MPSLHCLLLHCQGITCSLPACCCALWYYSRLKSVNDLSMGHELFADLLLRLSKGLSARQPCPLGTSHSQVSMDTWSMIALTDIVCCSVGAHVRDAAAYVCWAFARAYTAADMLESIAVLAPALLVTACYDREVSFRGASAIQFNSLQCSAAAAAAAAAAATSTVRHPAFALCKHGASWAHLMQ